MTRRAGRTRRRLFEREAELAAADEALSELVGLRSDDVEPPERPRGALLAFAGHAGLGKTTLLAEVRRRAAAKGCTVLSARGGDQEQRVAFHGLRGWDAMLRAEPAAVALGHAERALEGSLSWAVEDRGFEVPVLVALTFLYGDRPGRAEELFAAGTAEFERQGWRGAHLSFAYTLLAYIRYRRGRLAEAEDFVRAGLRLAERVGPRTPVEWYALGTLVEVLLARGRTDEAVRIAEDHDFGEPFPAAVTFAEVSGGAERTAFLEEAVAHLERSPAAYELARALVDLGTHLCRTRHPKEAAEYLYRGLEVAGQCGADGLADAARDELAAAGLRPRRLRAIETDALTARERAAAVLTAQGRDRAAVAAALHLDEQAVTRLLSAVYRKAGTDEAGLAEAMPEVLAVARDGGRGR
jgi:DNA-binding CsgD family transcriptional regulator